MSERKHTAADDRAAWRAHVDALLDDALSETFPASDPIAIGVAPVAETPPEVGDDGVGRR